jgi:uncharacterized protein (DUF433 family)
MVDSGIIERSNSVTQLPPFLNNWLCSATELRLPVSVATCFRQSSLDRSIVPAQSIRRARQHLTDLVASFRLFGPGFSNKVGFMTYSDIITMEPGKRGGKPCIRGLRITVYDVLEYLASGMTHPEILREFPYLTEEDIRACIAYVADTTP